MSFRLAPMSGWLAALTWILFIIPAFLLFAGVTAPPPANGVLLGIGLFMAAIYASVYFIWRPTKFEVDARTLRIIWPVRTREIARTNVEDARIVTSSEFLRDYGYGMRIGAGGLWGGFGLLMTRRETFSMWISRTDRLVIVRLRARRPLLVTPDEPERFVKAITTG